MLCIGVTALAVVQYRFPPDSQLNRYAWDDSEVKAHLTGVSHGDSYTRATGTFSYITGLATFSTCCFCYFLSRVGIGRRSIYRYYDVLGAASAVVCGFASGSRSAQVKMLCALVALVICRSLYSRMPCGWITIPLGLFLFVIGLWGTRLGTGTIERWDSVDIEYFTGRATGASTDQEVLQLLNAYPIGVGLGVYTGYGEVLSLRDSLALPYTETPFTKAVGEAGLPGLVAVGWTSLVGIALLRLSFGLSWSEYGPNLVPFGVGLLISLVYCLWYDHVGTALWWFVAGLCYWNQVVPRNGGNFWRFAR